MEFTRKVLASAVALTSTPVASGSVACKASDQFALYLNWTPAASGRTLTITIETSPSDPGVADASADWHQFGSYDYSDADTKDSISEDIQETSSGTSAVKYPPYIFACPATRIRIKYSQSGANGGTITATLMYRAS